ncbi:ATP-binding cassette domain-containing protein [Mycoplasmatota bacterium WC30]
MMIKLTNLNKYFNKGKTNEIHVIDNTSIDFPEKGLVALTGPSGCGKTTLLNVIGGLDKFGSGEIDFDGQIMKKYNPLEWDILRNNYVGYIFQNYNLITDKTVYENIETALNMAGLYDKEEIEKRINYVLEAVGMYNYRRRSVLALSGGQQQRVAIARAIAKNPKVVLADEPTGNLDANNTFEIMSIIKKISESCLVILVSHERTLVDFYADTVMELSDGKIINKYDNFGNKSFEHVDERNIYLKDLHKDSSLEEHKIERYYEDEKDESLSFQVIEIKDSIYIKAESGNKKKIKYLSDDTEIRLIDAHYKAKQTEDVSEYTFDLKQYGNIEHPKKKKSFIRLSDTFKQGFRKATSRRKFIGWLFLIAYFVISALVVYQLATFASLTRLDEKDFLKTAKNLISITTENGIESSDVDLIINNVDNVEWVPYSYSLYGRIYYSEYYQGDVNAGIQIYPMKASWVDETKIIFGEMIEDNRDIVIDVWIAEKLLENKGFSDLGVVDIEDLLGQVIYTQNQYGLGFEIVGIIETESPIVVVEDDAIYSFNDQFSVIPYGSIAGSFTITVGDDIQNADEVLMSSNANATMEIGDTFDLNGDEVTVVGVYEIDSTLQNEFNLFIVSNEYMDTLAKSQLDGYNYYNSDSIYFYSDDIDQAIEDINDYDENYEAFNSYEAQRNYSINAQKERVATRIQSIVITLVGIVIYIFFMMRSSMLSRIKEIGIYRSIGATKRDIFKIFIGEIFWFTTLGSLTGYLFMAFLINRIQNMLGELVSIFYFPIYYFVGGIVMIYLINLVFGLLPIFSLLRKTPSEINAKFDI